MSSKLIPCPSCERPISRDAISCPHCGAMATPGRQSRESPTVFGAHPFAYLENVVILGVAIWFISFFSKGPDEKPNDFTALLCLFMVFVIGKASWEMVKLWCQRIEVTTVSFNYRKGVFDQTITRLPRMGLDIHIERTFWGRVFGYGTVRVKTSNSELSFKGISLGSATRRRLLE